MCMDVFLCNLITSSLKDYALMLLIVEGPRLGRVKFSDNGLRTQADFWASCALMTLDSKFR